jgi:hypothetical protein
MWKQIIKILINHLKKWSEKTPNQYDDICVKALEDVLSHWYDN